MKTKNYNQFKFAGENRDLVPSHLRNLTNAIAEENLLELFPILINQRKEVIDGQHRLAAAKRLGVEIHYKVVKGNGAKITRLINAHQKGWQLIDFLNSYAVVDENYKLLKLFIEQWNIPISMGVRMVTDHQHGESDRFKRGLFKIDEKRMNEARTLLGNMRDLVPYLEHPTIWRSKNFYHALKTTYGKVNHERLMEKLSQVEDKRATKKLIEKSYSVRDYLRQLEDIVNHKISKDERIVRLFGK